MKAAVVCLLLALAATQASTARKKVEEKEKEEATNKAKEVNQLKAEIGSHKKLQEANKEMMNVDEDASVEVQGVQQRRMVNPPEDMPDVFVCPRELRAIYADMHDGDKKEITISGTRMTIKPSGNDQAWEVESVVDQESCSASINFNVPGKPNPPPVPLQAAMWYSVSHKGKKTVFEFTDPSGTLASKELNPKEFPLNQWVEEDPQEHVMSFACPDALHAVYADTHDGSKKEVVIRGTSLIIEPSGNNAVWRINAHLDPATCSASMPGRVPLQATVVYMVSATTQKTEFEFTDPSGTLASKELNPKEFPLKRWVEEVPQEHIQPTIAKDEPAEKKQITPSRANGKVFYILGKSVVQNACFCYKLEIGKTLHQRTPAVTCPDSNKTETESYSNERCKQEDTDWNVVIGEKQPVDKDNGMVQSYSEGTECEAAGKKRTSELTLISDKSATELTITVTEPSTCAYNVEVSGPLAELVGEN